MTSDYDRCVDSVERQIQDLRLELARLRRERPPEPVRDYAFAGPGGRLLRLSDLFDGRDALILVNNMGRSCPYCTLWADGLVGLLPHLASRAAVAVSSPDPPGEQARFAASRGWPFRMASVTDTGFLGDMGFLGADGGILPGLSVFTRGAGGPIRRAARVEFFPGDDFCAAWHILDLLPGGAGDWEPRFRYDTARPGQAGPRACCGDATA